MTTELELSDRWRIRKTRPCRDWDDSLWCLELEVDFHGSRWQTVAWVDDEDNALVIEADYDCLRLDEVIAGLQCLQYAYENNSWPPPATRQKWDQRSYDCPTCGSGTASMQYGHPEGGGYYIQCSKCDRRTCTPASREWPPLTKGGFNPEHAEKWWAEGRVITDRLLTSPIQEGYKTCILWKPSLLPVEFDGAVVGIRGRAFGCSAVYSYDKLVELSSVDRVEELKCAIPDMPDPKPIIQQEPNGTSE